MAREYAARNRKPARKKAAGGVPGWVWMIAGLSVGLAVAAFIYISRPTQQPLRGTAERAAGDERSAGGSGTDTGKPASGKAAATRGGKDKVPIPPKEKPRFTFYELLPSQEVLVPTQELDTPPKPQAPRPAETPPAPPAATATLPPGVAPAPVPPMPRAAAPAAAAPVPTPAPAAAARSGEAYMIQVASFRSQQDAEKQKAGLALMGIEARVEKVTIDNRDTYYRVRIGPERDAQRARATLAQLESAGLSGVLMKVK